MRSNIYKSLICEELDSHFKNSNIINHHQRGFTKCKSTELLMLHLTEKWKAALEEGKYVGVLFIDFKKAFDSIRHETLDLKLQACEVSGHLPRLIMSYLQNREQYVEVNGKRSDHHKVKYGVPQGSLLGPRLFNSHVFDPPEVPSKGELEDVLHEVNEWCKQNCLTIHPDKTEVMIISRWPMIGPLKPVKLKDYIVRYVSESECLGMTVDNRLRWNSHIKKASSNLIR